VRLRLNPASIPEGKTSIVPSNFYTRLRHKPFQPQAAVITHVKEGQENLLKIRYESVPRALTIRYEAISPYRITGWEETDNGKLMSRGTRKAVLMSPYWQQNQLQFDSLRDSLRLMF
jgi:hypothetical protein